MRKEWNELKEAWRDYRNAVRKNRAWRTLSYTLKANPDVAQDLVDTVIQAYVEAAIARSKRP